MLSHGKKIHLSIALSVLDPKTHKASLETSFSTAQGLRSLCGSRVMLAQIIRAHFTAVACFHGGLSFVTHVFPPLSYPVLTLKQF